MKMKYPGFPYYSVYLFLIDMFTLEFVLISSAIFTSDEYLDIRLRDSILMAHFSVILFLISTIIPERQVWIAKNKWKFTSLLLKTIFFIVGYHSLILLAK